MRLSVLFFLLFWSLHAPAQEGSNLRDTDGKPQGFWYIKHPERMGEPAYSELGTYSHGRKFGVWHVLSQEGDLMASQRFKNNALDGESRYYENGRLSVVGNYRGLNPDQAYDTILVKDPITGFEKSVVISTERGSTRHGTWTYYDPQTGMPYLVEEYQVDDLISHRNMGVSKEDSSAYLQRAGKLPHNAALPPPKIKPTRLIER